MIFNSVISFIASYWVPRKVQRLDTSVFTPCRLQDYANCLWNLGLKIPLVCGFVDGTFHSVYRPGRDGYKDLHQKIFYSGAKKGHGIVFEMITFPDGMIGRAWAR